LRNFGEIKPQKPLPTNSGEINTMKNTLIHALAAFSLLFGGNLAFGQQPPSMQTHTQNGQTLVNYPSVPGWDDLAKAPLPIKSPHFKVRVRSAATGDQWVDCFANYTYNRADELPEIPPTDGSTWFTVVQAYQKHTRGWSHSYSNIEMSAGSPVEVEISRVGTALLNGLATIDPARVAVHPAQKVVPNSLVTQGGKVFFKITDPCQLVIDINGQMDNHNAAFPSTQVGGAMPGGGPVHALSLFANPVITKPASSGSGIVTVTPGTIPNNDPATFQTMVFLPGVHDIGRGFLIHPGKSYYIPGDAVVFGTMNNEAAVAGSYRSIGDSISIYGCGTLSGQRITHYRFVPAGQPSRADRSLTISESVDVTLLGVTLADSSSHSTSGFPWNGTDLTPGSTSLRWMKTITWRANGDGFGGYDLVEDSFLRTADDCSYIKGNRRRCTFWKDANAALFHMATAPSGPIVIEDCDVIYNRLRTTTGFNGGGFQQRGEGPYGVHDVNVTIKDFRFHDRLANMSVFNLVSYTADGGVVVPAQSYRGLRFENISLEPPMNGIKQKLLGCAEVPWFGGLIFKNITIGGVPLTKQNFNTYFNTNEFVDFVLFNEPQNLPLTIQADASRGSVLTSPATPTQVEMSFVTLTAVAKPGYTFTGWSGDVTGTTNPVTLRMTEAKAITANFAVQDIALPIVINSPISGTWTVPPGVFSATFDTWGGGGAGGSAQHSPGSTNVSVRGGGGSGAGFARKTLQVWPGQVISCVVGAGGAGADLGGASSFPSSGSFGGNGGVSSASVNGGPPIVSAVGGLGGQNRSGTTSSVGGSSRAAVTTGSIGDVVFYGGGGAGSNSTGTGGGGGSAGALGAGGTAPSPTSTAALGGAAGAGGGGTGAAGHNSTNAGNAGAQPGAGGSGAAMRNNAAASALCLGGKGGDGKMVVTYNTMVVYFNLTTQAVNGSITRSQAGPSHLAGSSVTLTAVADAGYRFIGWSGGLSGTANPATVLMDDDKTITANFIQQFTLITNAGSGGSISAGGTYDAGTPVTVTAAAANGYRFGSWSGDASGSTHPLTLIMDGPKSVTANFIQQFTLTTSAGIGGSISGGGIYDEGTIVNVSANPAGGYRFGFWSGDLSGTNGTKTLVMNSDKVVQASFIRRYALTTSAGTGGTVTGGGNYDAGSTATVAAIPSSGYRFNSWSGALTGSTSSASLVMDSAKSVSASFVKTFTLNSSVVGGSITLDPPGGTYDTGTQVTVTATPDSPELTFLRWTGDLASQPNGCTLTMDKDYTFAAEFLGSITLTTPGTSTWTVPTGVTRVTLSAWGGGGAGGSASAARSITSSKGTSARGGGGAGGGFASTTFRVTPAQPVSLTLGKGGAAPATVTTNNSDSEAGDDTTAVFNSVTLITAKGGLGGKNALIVNGVANLNGGAAQMTGPVGTLVFNGGNGAAGNPNGTGGGGGSAGSAGPGGNAPDPASNTGGAAGAAPPGFPDESGAVGGTGHNGTGAGTAGGTPGAGGSGAGVRFNSGTLSPTLTHRIGGSGAHGRLMISYIVTPTAPQPEVSVPASIIGSEVEVRWPLNYSDWYLEESHTTDPATAVWIEIPPPYTSDANGIFWRSPDLSNLSSFYRLSRFP
jgi:uncharacterized repeat protein (TIGR02543 family)